MASPWHKYDDNNTMAQKGRKALNDTAPRGKYQTPTGDIDSPYENADREADINRRTRPSDPSKVAEDRALFKKSGAIAPYSRVGRELQLEKRKK